MLKKILCGFVAVAAISSVVAPATADSAALRELAPTGTLRVGIAVSPSPSAFFSIRDPATGKLRGVAVDLGTELARRLGVPVEFVVHANSGALTEAAGGGTWDVAFMPVDDERKAKVDFGPAYNLFESTYLVRGGLPMVHVADVDREGVRVVGVENTTTIRAAIRSLKSAKVTPVKTVEAAIDMVRAERADAIALSRNSLLGLVDRVPGSRIAAGHFHATSTAVAVPKNRPAALAYVSVYIEDAKASGLVRRALDAVGLKDATVAPPGAR